MTSDASNILYFTAYGGKIKPNIKNAQIEFIYDYNKIYEKEIKLDFQRKTYNYFNRIKDFEDEYPPTKIVSQFFLDFKENNKLNEDILISKNILHKLDWIKEKRNVNIINPYTNYYGDYKGYDGVFEVTLNYIFSDESLKNEIIDATQSFYLIENKNKCRIIDIGGLKEDSLAF